MIKCLECGSDTVHMIAYNTDHVNTAILQSANTCNSPIKDIDLPYIIAGHYCEKCQRFVSVYSDNDFTKAEENGPAPQGATVKQVHFIKNLLNQCAKNPSFLYEHIEAPDYSKLTRSEASQFIEKLQEWLNKHPSKTQKKTPKATDKQISLIKRKIAEGNVKALKYSSANLDALNITEAKKIITDILD